MSRWRHRAQNRPVYTIDPAEAYPDQKNAVRGILQANRWRRDGRCKKFETYKKTINGVIHRVKFDAYYVLYDSFVDERERTGNSERNRWNNINMLRYQNINTLVQIEHMLGAIPANTEVKSKIPSGKRSTYEPTTEDRENEVYLERMGI